MACGGIDFITKFQFWRKKISFNFIKFNFFCSCSINFKRQSEPSGLRPDTSSLVDFILELERGVRMDGRAGVRLAGVSGVLGG